MSIDPNPAAPIDLAQLDPAALNAVLQAAAALLSSGLAPAPAKPTVTLGQYVTEQLAALRAAGKKGKARSHSPGLRLLADGAHGTCQCDCPACQGPGGCPCACGCDVTPDGTHQGRTADDAHPAGHHATCTGRPGACAARWTGRGSVPMTDLTVADLEQAQAWVAIRARAFNRNRDRQRARKGKKQRGHDGRGAEAWFVTAARWLWKRAILDQVVPQSQNPPQALTKPEQSDLGARSLPPEALMEVYSVAMDTSEDPDGDGLLMMFFIQTAARCGGVLTAAFGRLDVERATFKVTEPKRNLVRHEIAITPDLARRLHLHALERGPRIAAPADAPEHLRRTGIPDLAPTDPLLYRLPIDTFDADGYFVRREVRPMTDGSIQNVRARVRKNLPWAEECGLRWHDIRHTVATMLDRLAGHAVAAYHLGHKTPADMTATYTKASLEEDAAAIAVLFNCDHPLAPKRDVNG